MNYTKWLIFSVCTLLFIQCAKIVPPTGGPTDQVAPGFVIEESTPNGLTNFKPDETEFTFDEYILLNNPDRNIIISPPLSPPPTFYLSRKTVVGDWSDIDSFRSNTTYTVNLGNAVEDLNEGNPLTDFVFAFSTGPVLDSLKWEVEVIGPEGKPVEQATVLLYEEFGDSVVSNRLPFYFAKTNVYGEATFRYLKEGKYKVVALQDNNLTLTYDLASEAIGFLDSPLVLPQDSSSIQNIRMFIPKPEPILAQNPTLFNNKINFILTEIDTHQQILPLADESIITQAWEKDTLQFWPTASWQDSIVFKWVKKDSSEYFSISPPDSFQFVQFKPKNTLEFKGKEAVVIWNQPVIPEADSVFYWTDSLKNKYYLKHMQRNPLTTYLTWNRDSLPNDVKLYVDPGNLGSPYGFNNRDTIMLNFRYIAEDQLGSYQLTLSQADTNESYIGRLLQSGSIIKEKYFQNDSTFEWSIPDLRGGEYKLHLIRDTNGNRKQDGGSYWEKRHPELPVEFTLPKLRANWVIEEEINISDAIKGE